MERPRVVNCVRRVAGVHRVHYIGEKVRYRGYMSDS